MADRENLQRTLETLKGLKDDYYIGSQRAFGYLKAWRWLEYLLDQMKAAENGKLIQSFDLTTRRLGWMIDTLDNIIPINLELAIARSSTPKSWTLETTHQILTPVELHPGSNDRGFKEYRWTIDYAREIPNILIGIAASAYIDTEEFRREEIDLPKLWEDPDGFVSYLAHVFHTYLVNGRLKLISNRTKKKFSLRQICHGLQRRPCKWPWDIVAGIIENDEDLDEYDRSMLIEAQSKGDLETAHRIAQQECVQLHDQHANHVMTHSYENLKCNSISIDRWLHDDEKLFKRADLEYTLGRKEVERRIILNAIHTFQLDSEGEKFETTEERIDSFLAVCKRRTRENQRRADDCKQENALPGSIEFFQGMANRYSYICTAINQNRKWLIDFLSR